MAISVKDIQEKDFPKAANGYAPEEVDDFLDEISESLAALIRENLTLKGQVSKMTDELNEKEKALKAAIAKTPDYNEEGYFKNLQSAMRDSLISAQRVADEALSSAKAEADQIVTQAQAEAAKTVAEANAEADKALSEAAEQAAKTVSEAEAKAAAMTETATSETNAIRSEYEALKAASDNYRANFRKLVEDQLGILKASDMLFK